MLKEFDISSYRSYATYLIIGHHNNGKSTLAKQLISFGGFEKGVVFNPSESQNNDYGDMQNAEVHVKYDSNVLEAFMKNANGRDFVVFDDCFYNSRYCKDTNITHIFKNKLASAILTMLYPIGMSPELRSTLDYVFLFRQGNLRNRKLIFDMFVSWSLDYGVFEAEMDEIQTLNYHCLVVDNVNHDLFIYNVNLYR